MSKFIASAAIRGAHKIVKRVEKKLAKALETYGPDQQVEFPNTAYYLPIIYGILGIPVQTVQDMVTVLERAKSLLPPLVEDRVWLPYLGHALDAGMATFFAEEIEEALKYLQNPPPYLANEPNPTEEHLWLGAANDVILRERGIQFVDGTAPGFAAIVGAAPNPEIAVRIARELQENNLYVFISATSNGQNFAEQLREAGVQMGWETRLVPFGRDLSATVFSIGFATRVAMSFGGIEPGDYRRILLYNKNRVFAFVMPLGPVDDEKFANAAGAINWGFPTIADTDITQILPTGVCTYEHVVSPVPHEQIVSRAIEVRGLKVQVSEVPVPVPYGPAFEGETVRREEMHVEFGGRASTAFEFLQSRNLEEVEDHRIEVIGPDVDEVEEGGALPLAIVVEVAGREMQPDFEPILERRIHDFINGANGVWHMGQRDIIWTRISKEAFEAGFRIRHYGEIVWAKLHEEFSAIVDKVQVSIYTRQEDVERLLPMAQAVYQERDERIAGMTDESVETFYTCTLCVPPGEVIVLPDGSFKRVENLIEQGVETPLQVLSFNQHQFESKPVEELFINPSPSTLRRIWLTNGNSLTLTPNHKVLVDRESGLEWIKAEYLQPGDRLVSTSTTCLSDQQPQTDKAPLIVDYLPDSLRVYDEDFLAKLKRALQERYGTWAAASRASGIAYQRLYGAFYTHPQVRNRPRLTLREVKSLCKCAGLPWEEVKGEVREWGISGRVRLGQTALDADLMYAAGLVAADGHIKRCGKSSTVQFTNTEPTLVERFRKIMRAVFGVEPRTYHVPPFTAEGAVRVKGRRACRVVVVNSPLAGRFLLQLGIGRKAGRREKWDGETISTFPPELVAAFLRGLFDGDGHVTGSHICISTGSYREAQHILLLLKKLGIAAYITKTTRGFQVGTRSGRDFLRFREVVFSEHPGKRTQMEAVEVSADERHVSRTQVVPLECARLLKQLLAVSNGQIKTTKLPVDYKTWRAWLRGERRPSKEKLRLVLQHLEGKVPSSHPAWERLTFWCDSTLTLEKVKRVEVLENGHRAVYNFSVQDTHNYLVNGIVVKNCQSFAPNHVCIITPERPGLCGAYNWLDAKAAYQIDPTGPNQPVEKGRCIDPLRGQWEGVNEVVREKSRGHLEIFNNYSLMEFPMTSCGCFECIMAILPEANGVMIVNREYLGMTPCGMKFSTLAGSVGGGQQTPGFLGHSRLYITSRKFILAEGGLPRVVWMPKELKEMIGDRLVKRCEELGMPDLPEKIADETIAETIEDLLPFLEKVGHPALSMEPLL